MKFYVNYVSPDPSKFGTHQLLLTVLGTVAVERDSSAKSVFCVWLPGSQLETYKGFLKDAKASAKKFALEAEVADIQVKPPFTNKDGVVTQDIVFKFSGAVTKSLEADASVTW
jgi:23S rRNA A2030 N6-methylase RlmJ